MKQSTEERYGPVVLECVSKSKPDREPYRVRLKDGHYSCNCKGWIFCKGDRLKSNGDRRCIHTDRAEGLGPELNGPVELLVQDRRQQEVKQGYVYGVVVIDKLLECLPVHMRTKALADQFSVVLKANGSAPKVVPAVRVGVRRIVFDD